MKEKYIKVEFPDRSFFVTDHFDITMLDGLLIGEKVKISKVEMTREEYEKLPEFEG
jgi:hypothetical protein